MRAVRGAACATVALSLIGQADPAVTTHPGANGKIAYVHRSQIWVVNRDGSDRHQITSGDAFNDTPAWSPDGSLNAFVNEIAGISVMDPGGGSVRNVVHVPGNWAPTWAPDGHRIAFETVNGIAVVNLDGTELRFLTQPPLRGGEPAWSPDGRRIAFMRARTARQVKAPHFDLYGINPDGSGLKRLTHSPGEDTQPSWSPDGATIVFTRFMRPNGRYCIRIYAVQRNGRGLRKLRGDCPLPDVQPEWSPDGKRIAFETYRPLGHDGRSEIVVMRANGKSRRAFEPRLSGVSPTWQPLP